MSENYSEKKSDAAATRDSEPFLVLAATRPQKRGFWQRRRLIVAALVLALVGSGSVLAVQFGLLSSGSVMQKVITSLALNAVANFAKSPEKGNPGSQTTPGEQTGLAENLAGLALQGISLFNGEKGAELWRLKASWAHLSQEGDTILVDAPVVRYTMGEPADEDYLDVKSEKGTVTDSQRHLTLTGNVNVRRMDDVVTGPQMNYDSKTRIMVFPDGARLESERATGDADVFTWDLTNNTMLAEGNVDIVLKPQQDVSEQDSPTGEGPKSTVDSAIQSTIPAVIPAIAPTAPVKKVSTAAQQKKVTQQNTTTPQKKARTQKKAAPQKKAITKKTGTTKAVPKQSAPKTSTPKKSATTAPKVS